MDDHPIFIYTVFYIYIRMFNIKLYCAVVYIVHGHHHNAIPIHSRLLYSNSLLRVNAPSLRIINTFHAVQSSSVTVAVRVQSHYTRVSSYRELFASNFTDSSGFARIEVKHIWCVTLNSAFFIFTIIIKVNNRMDN